VCVCTSFFYNIVRNGLRLDRCVNTAFRIGNSVTVARYRSVKGIRGGKSSCMVSGNAIIIMVL